MSDERKKHGWIFWTAAALLMTLVLYPVSFGPVCWIAGRCHVHQHPEIHQAVTFIYWPLAKAAWACRGRDDGNDFVFEALWKWGGIGDPTSSSMFGGVAADIIFDA